MLNTRRATLFLLVAGVGALQAQPSAAPSPFASLALGVGATSVWHESAGESASEGQIEDSAPSLTAQVVGGITLGRSFRVAATGDLTWIAAGDQEPDLAVLAGAHLEYIFPPGFYYLFGEAGLCWHIVDPGDSTRETGWGTGFAVGAGYRLTRVLSVEAKCSFSGYDETGDGDARYRHISLLAALRAMLE